MSTELGTFQNKKKTPVSRLDMPPSKQPPKRRSTCVKPPASSKNKVPVTAPQHSIAPIFYEVTQNKLKNGTLICETNPSNEYHIYTIPNHL